MTQLTVAQVKDLSNQGGMSFSNGSITANGTLNAVSYTHLTLPTKA